MAEDRKAWKSTEDNPYYSVYGAEKVPFLQRPEKNVILLDDCAERRDKWQHCLKKIEGPGNENSSNLHLCNELWGRYKFCIEMYKAQKRTDVSRWYCHKEQDEATKTCLTEKKLLTRDCRRAEQKVEDCLKKQHASTQEKELFQTKTYKDW